MTVISWLLFHKHFVTFPLVQIALVLHTCLRKIPCNSTKSNHLITVLQHNRFLRWNHLPIDPDPVQSLKVFKEKVLLKQYTNKTTIILNTITISISWWHSKIQAEVWKIESIMKKKIRGRKSGKSQKNLFSI